MKPRITVIVPIYACEPYVGACIASLRTQTMGDFEAICIDDATPDGSAKLAEKATEGDKRFRFASHEQNRGLSAARNTGLGMAEGDYVLFLDSDDLLEPNALQRLAETAEEHELDLLDFNASIFYEPGATRREALEVTYKNRPLYPGVHTGEELFCFYQAKRHYASPACFRLVRRSLLEENGLAFEEGILHEDELFTPLLYAYAARAMYLDEALYRYRIHEGSIVATRRGIRNASSLFTISCALHGWLEEHASQHSDAFADAMAQHIFTVRMTMAEDILQCSGEELVEYQGTLTPAQRVAFSEQGIQLAAWLEELHASRSWKLGNALATLPRRITRLARK